MQRQNIASQPKIEARLVPVTPDIARKWLDNCLWSKQRRLRPWHVTELAEAMRRNEFVEGTQIHFAKLKDEIHLANGQHTLNAIVTSGVTVPLSVLTTVVKSEEEIAALYSRHDRHLSRTLTDTYGAHDLGSQYELSRPQVEAVGCGIKAIMNGFENASSSNTYAARSSDERVRQFKEYGPAGHFYFEAIKGCPTAAMRELRVAAVVGVALLTFNASAELAKGFWSQVAYCDGLSVGDPRKTLMNWLMANPQRRVNPALRARIAAHAWNLFVEGKKASRFRTPDLSTPVVIKKP